MSTMNPHPVSLPRRALTDVAVMTRRTMLAHVRVPALNRLDARVLDPWREPAMITETLAEMCRHMGRHHATAEAVA